MSEELKPDTGGVESYRSQLVKQLEELADSYEPANSMDTTDMWKRDGVRDAIALVLRGIEPRPAPAEASEDTKEQPWYWET